MTPFEAEVHLKHVRDELERAALRAQRLSEARRARPDPGARTVRAAARFALSWFRWPRVVAAEPLSHPDP